MTTTIIVIISIVVLLLILHDAFEVMLLPRRVKSRCALSDSFFGLPGCSGRESRAASNRETGATTS